jgi:hypothetical protein
MEVGNMKTIILFICQLLLSSFNFLFCTAVVENRNERVFKRLLTLSQIDAVEKEISLRESEGGLPSKEKVLEKCLSSPQVVDIRKQFRSWSQNMKDYDQIRNCLINSA